MRKSADFTAAKREPKEKGTCREVHDSKSLMGSNIVNESNHKNNGDNTVNDEQVL
jgi:hypothetical protein